MTFEAVLDGMKASLRHQSDGEAAWLSTARPYPPASTTALQVAEGELGRKIHPHLRRVLGEIANGGVGPGNGLVGVSSGHADDEGRTLVAFTRFLTEAFPSLPTNAVGLCDWGGSVWSALGGENDESILTLWEGGVVQTPWVFDEWLACWFEGRDLFHEMFEWKELRLKSFVTHSPVQAIGRRLGI